MGSKLGSLVPPDLVPIDESIQSSNKNVEGRGKEEKKCDGLFSESRGPSLVLGSAAAPTTSARTMTGRLTTAAKRIVVIVTGMQVWVFAGNGDSS